jgi:hypothetical protein
MEGRSRDLIPDTIADFVSGELTKSARNLRRDSVVGTLTTVQVERSGVRIPAGTRNVSLLQKALPTPGPIKLPIKCVLGFFSQG